jgi:hypothetical protein
MSNENNEKQTSNETKKTQKVPNTLIIYIKTRIPNFYKINYEPYMTVPSSKSRTVYFDPLIEYYTLPIRNLPSGAPPQELYTQFFEPNQFDTMMNRILSDFRYMQKPRTLEDATARGIVDNNIEITLKTLFRNNNLFYINKKPYTIVKMNWNKTNWQIDTKPIDRLIQPFSQNSGKELEKAEEELDDIPEFLRQGNLASANLVNEENSDNLGLGLKNKKAVISKSDTNISLPIIADEDVLEHMSERTKNLYGKLLKKNIPINYSDDPDLIRDTLTLSLLVNNSQLEDFLQRSKKTNKKSDILKYYNAYINGKKNLADADSNYLINLENLIKDETTLNNYFIEINSETSSVGSNKSGGAINITNLKTDSEKSKKTEIINNILELKKEYYVSLFNLSDALLNIYESQQTYFANLVLLLEEIKTEYVNIIKYYKQPVLAEKCIEYDIDTISLLLKKDSNNIYSVSYFDNYNKFKKCHKCLQKYKEKLLNPKINYYDEINKYFENDFIATIEKYQYEIYNSSIILYYTFNQFDIWKIFYESLDVFVKSISTDCASQINIANVSLENYNSNYSLSEQSSFMKKYKIDGIRASLDEKKHINWFLVKSDGSRAITKSSAKGRNYENDLKQEKLLIDVSKNKTDAYDSIMLISYLLEIQCLRQQKVYISEENTNQISLGSTYTLIDYYKEIIKYIEGSGNSITDDDIPESLMWDTRSFSNIDFLQKKIEISSRMQSIYINRISIIQDLQELLEKHCEKLYDILFPSMTDKGFVDQCLGIINENITTLPKYTTRSSYWLKKQEKNYDTKRSMDLIFNLSIIAKNGASEGYLDDPYPSDIFDWFVYDNEGQGDCLFASVRDALNGEMDATDQITENPYTEVVGGKNIFTVSSLRKIVADNYTDNDYKNQCELLGGNIINGKCVLYDFDSSINPPIYDLLVKQDGITVRTIEEVRDYISHPCANNIGFNFWGDEMAIQILETILQIKLIIIDMTTKLNKNRMEVGDLVVVLNYEDENEDNDYRIVKIDRTKNPPTYTVRSLNNEITDLKRDDLGFSKNNIYSTIRVNCLDNPNLIDVKDCIFLLKTRNEVSNVEHYEFVRFTKTNNYVYEINNLPQYIKYFIYDSCYRFLTPESKEKGFGRILEFQQIFDNFDLVNSSRIINSVIPDESEPLLQKLQKYQQKIDLYNNEYRNLEMEINDLISKDNKYDYAFAKENKEIRVLNDRLDNLLQKMDKITMKMYRIQEKLDDEQSGGLAPLSNKPSKEYGEYAASNIPPIGYQPFNNSMSGYSQGLQYNPALQYNQGFPQPGINYGYPRPQYNQQPYYQQPYRSNIKELSSKLAYYISIELELYPGTSVNPLQKSALRCQNTFERIREAYSDIFGYQYRPSALKEAYGYNYYNNYSNNSNTSSNSSNSSNSKTQRKRENNSNNSNTSRRNK